MKNIVDFGMCTTLMLYGVFCLAKGAYEFFMIFLAFTFIIVRRNEND